MELHRKGSVRISYSFSGSVSSKKEEKFVEGEDIFAVVCVLGMFGATAYHIAMQIKNGLQERHREPQKHALAKFLHCTPESVRSMLETTNSFGIAWRQAGSVNRGFLVPTAVFVRWYLRMM